MIDWQQLAAYVLLGLGGTGGISAALYAAWKKWAGRTRWVAPPTTTEPPERLADEPAPAGAVEWVEDICNAMGSSKAESVLQALRDGATRDDARSRRIGELEREEANRELTEATK